LEIFVTKVILDEKLELLISTSILYLIKNRKSTLGCCFINVF
jgi:hypothetical protein